MRKKYIGIALPEELIVEMDKLIKQGTQGYKSRAELAKDAIRFLIRDLKKK